MKKSLIILTVLVLVVACAAFVGCSNIAPQSLLELPWDKYTETAVYSVSDTEGNALGNMTATYQQFNKFNLDIATYIGGEDKVQSGELVPAYKETQFYGLVVTTRLKINDGQFKDSIVVLDKQSRVKYSYSNSHFKNNDTDEIEIIESIYDYSNMDKNHNVTMKYEVKGKINESGEIKLKPFEQLAYFDNAYYLAITRTLGPVNQPRQISFLTHSFREDKMLRRIAANAARPAEVKLSATSEIKLDQFEYPKKDEPKPEEDADKPTEPKPEEPKDTVTCTITSIASAETMPGSGTPITYYVAAVPYKFNDSVKAEKLLIKFIEHGISYDLQSITLA